MTKTEMVVKQDSTYSVYCIATDSLHHCEADKILAEAGSKIETVTGTPVSAGEPVVYPNPSSGRLLIDLNGAGTVKDIWLVSSGGQRLKTSYHRENARTLIVENLRNLSGVYILDVQTDRGFISRKVTLTGF